MLAAKRWLDVPADGRRVINLLADYSFGIYLIHPAFQHLLVRLTPIVGWPALLADTVMLVTSLVLSLVFVWVIRFVPGFRDKV